jgi:hypothetical protein
MDQRSCGGVKAARITGENSSSTKRWNNVPRGTMDEVSSHVRLDLPTARSPQRLFHLVFGPHDGTAYVPIPERSTSPRVMLRPTVVDSLKALDPNRPIREADITMRSTNVRFWE